MPSPISVALASPLREQELRFDPVTYQFYYQCPPQDLASGLIYPPQSHILDASLHVTKRLAAYIFDQGLARVPRPDDVGALIRARAYRPVYPE